MSSLPPIDAAAPQPPPAARTAEEAAALDAELQQLHDQLGVKRGAALSEALKPELSTPMPEGLREVAQKAAPPGAAPATDPPPAAAPDPPPAAAPAMLALPAPEDVTNLITLDVSTGQAVVLDALGPVVVNTDGTLARITNWDRMDDSEREVAKRRIAKRNVERLKAFHARGDLKAELVSALAGAPASADGLAAIAEGSG